jgi:hypothetical protein
MVRTLGETSQAVKKTGWHTDAMEMWGTNENMQKAYNQAAERELKRIKENK